MELPKLAEESKLYAVADISYLVTFEIYDVKMRFTKIIDISIKTDCTTNSEACLSFDLCANERKVLQISSSQH